MIHGIRSKLLISILFIVGTVFTEPIILHLPLKEDSTRVLKEFFEHKDDNSLALVLSGGGSRGLAHIGVFKAFEEEAIDIDLIVGTSIGATMGSIYSAGYDSQAMTKFFKRVDWGEIFGHNDQRANKFLTQKLDDDTYILKLRTGDGNGISLPTGYTKGFSVQSQLTEILGPANYISNGNFDRLNPKFRSIACDLTTGDAVIFDRGNLPFAVRSSMSIPLYFEPIGLEDMQLVDGGLRYPIPTEIADSMGANIIVAVDVTANPVRSIKDLNTPMVVLQQTTTIMAEDQKQRELEISDIVIKPDIKDRYILDFDNIENGIQSGYEATMEIMPDLKKLLAHRVIEESNLLINQTNPQDLVNIPNCQPISMDQIITELQYLYNSGLYNSVSAELQPLGSGEYDLEIITEKIHPLRKIVIDSRGAYPLETLFSYLPLPGDSSANLRIIQNGLDELINRFHADGYLLAQLEKANYSENGSLYVAIDEGIIEKIMVKGNRSVKSWYIKSLLPIKEGDIYKSRAIRKSLLNLQSTDLFDDFHQDIQRGREGAILTIYVRENAHTMLALKAHYDRFSNGIIGGTLADENFIGMGQRLEMGFHYGISDKEFTLKHTADKIWKSNVTSRFAFIIDEKRIDYFRNMDIIESNFHQKIGIEILLGRHIQRIGTSFLGFSIYDEKLETSERDFRKNYKTRNLIFRSIVDTYDRRDFPTKGKYHISEYIMSQDILGGQQSYYRMYLSLQSYYDIFDGDFNYHVHLTGGYSGGNVPEHLQFTISELVPFWGMRGDEFRGYSYISTGIDLRYTLYDGIVPVYMTTGISVGRTWDKDDMLRLNDLQAGEGLAIGVLTPVGPIELSWGILNTEDYYNWNFRLGRK